MLLESKSLLAKLMATENLVVEQRKVSTAMFDPKSRVLVIPILNNDIPSHTYDLFMGHEVGHALWTPVSGYDQCVKLNIPYSLANLVEDSRIERKIKYKYPGLKNSFVRGYIDLIERDFFKTKNLDVNSLKFVDRLNLFCKSGAYFNISFTETERELVRAVESTETFDDVLEVCKKIINFMKDSIENPVPMPIPFDMHDDSDMDEDDLSDLMSNDNREEDENESTDGNTDETEEESEEDFDGTGEVASESEKTEETEETEEKPEDESGNVKEKWGSDKTAVDEKLKELLESATDQAYKENEHKLFDAKAINYEYANIPKLSPEDTVLNHKIVWKKFDEFAVAHDFSQTQVPFYDFEGFKKLRDEIKTGVSYLVKEFEMRKSADQLKKATPARTGDLNMSKIYSHKFNEDIFKKITVMPGEKSHGLVIFLDWSGSMTDHLRNTVKQLFNIVMFCKKVNIPYEVYSFTTFEYSEYSFRQTRKTGDLIMENFKLLNLLSSRMTAMEFTKAAAALMYMSSDSQTWLRRPTHQIFQMNGTPLNQTIVAAMEIVPEFQRRNGLQIVNTIFLTDGDGDASLIKATATGTLGMTSYNYGMGKRNRNIIRDPVTKHQEEIDYSTSRSITSAFIKLFKYRTKSNIVGFYILSPHEFKSYLFRQFESKGESTQDIRSNFSKNHCAVIKNDGFDEYYLLRSKKGDSEEVELEVKENASTKVLATAFGKYNNKRNNNRIVLNRFINMIA